MWLLLGMIVCMFASSLLCVQFADHFSLCLEMKTTLFFWVIKTYQTFFSPSKTQNNILCVVCM